MTDTDVALKHRLESMFEDYSLAGNARGALRTLLLLVEVDPANVNARERAATLLIEKWDIKHRAMAREILEEGLSSHGITEQGLQDLYTLYWTIGPRDSMKFLFRQYNDVLKRIIAPDFYAQGLQYVSAEAEEAKAATAGDQRRVKRAKYPSTEAFRGSLNELFSSHIANAPAGTFKIAKSDRIFTLGSCFARRIERALTQFGMDAAFIAIHEVANTTFANVDLLRHVVDGAGPRMKYWSRELEVQHNSIEQMRARIAATNVVIYTLGVAPAFFRVDTGAYTPHTDQSFRSASFKKENVARMTTVAENVANLHAIYGLLRTLTPQIKLVVTVSPVPLGTTFERSSAVVADCVSKSTLRVAAEEFVNATADTIYWPSFEMVRWVTGHREPFFGMEDGDPAHISEDVISIIVETFLGKHLHA